MGLSKKETVMILPGTKLRRLGNKSQVTRVCSLPKSTENAGGTVKGELVHRPAERQNVPRLQGSALTGSMHATRDSGTILCGHGQGPGLFVLCCSRCELVMATGAVTEPLEPSWGHGRYFQHGQSHGLGHERQGK